MGVVPALDEIEYGKAGDFGVRPKCVAVDELTVGLNAEITPGLTNSSSSACRMDGRSRPSSLWMSTRGNVWLLESGAG